MTDKQKLIMRSGISRIDYIASLINSGIIKGKSICDLGSRDEVLNDKLDIDIKYVGVDIYPLKTHTIYSNIDQKIELNEKFDIVTALDVLEHTNDIQNAIKEMIRICRGTFIINLPNELTLLYRLRLLFGKISGKFSVNLKSLDRHRWFFTLQNVERLILQSDISNYEIQFIAFYKKGRLLSKFNFFLGKLGLHSLAAHSFIIIGK